MSIYADYRLDDGAARDPIEDAVSLGTVASLGPDLVRILVSVGLGTDRYNHVSNASSLRAIAELTHLGGFLGSVSLEPSGPCFRFYRDCLEHIYRAQGFRSVLAGTIASAIQGWFGRDVVPPPWSRASCAKANCSSGRSWPCSGRSTWMSSRGGLSS